MHNVNWEHYHMCTCRHPQQLCWHKILQVQSSGLLRKVLIQKGRQLFILSIVIPITVNVVLVLVIVV